MVIEEGKTEVVYGNYDTYQLLVNARALAAKEEAKAAGRKPEPAKVAANPRPTDGTNGNTKRKRKYPFRRIAEIERDIAVTEEKITELEFALVSPDIYRDATRLKQTMTDIEAAKTKLPQLFEHWEEAVELNNER